jgi:hypothetical protein
MNKLAPLMIVLMLGLIPNIAHAEEPSASLAQRMLPRAQQVGSVESVEVISSSLGNAQVALDPLYVPYSSDDEQATIPVDIVVMHGQFSDTLAKVPRDAPPPKGATMAFTVNSGTGEVTEVYVGNLSPQIGAVVFKTTNVAATAKAAQVRARISRRDRLVARAATWGSKCSAGNGHHCYATADWEMKSTEYVYGSETAQYTSQINVPDWEIGDFVDNEEWISFFNSPVGTPYWTEIGQEAGNYRNCCSLQAFLAYQNHSGYHEASLMERHLLELNYYTMKSVGGGTWCFYIGPGSETNEGCVGGFETVSKELEDGVEAADEAQPTNAGYVETDWIAAGGEAYQWNFAHNGLWNETGQVSYNGLCVAQYTPWNWPGNIYYGSYGNCP